MVVKYIKYTHYIL